MNRKYMYITLLGVVTFILFLSWLVRFPEVSISDQVEVAQNSNREEPGSEDLGQDTLSIASNSQGDQIFFPSTFQLSDYPVLFAVRNLEETIKEEILEEVSKLLDQRIYTKLAPPTDRFVIVSGREYKIAGYLEFNNLELDTAYYSPLLIDLTNIRSSLQTLIENGSQETLYIPEELIELYQTQIQLRNQNEDVFEKLDGFVSRLNMLANEVFTPEMLNQFYYPSRSEWEDLDQTAEPDHVENLLAGQISSLVAEYREVDLLNVARISQLLQSNFGGEAQEDTFVARLSQRKERTSGVPSDMIISLIYDNVDNEWKIFAPL